ncbi:hypothetical protein NL676_012659 [Syzygium grande]|nr:hypothetical protein NL676_012659 [Syzygium grande]
MEMSIVMKPSIRMSMVHNEEEDVMVGMAVNGIAKVEDFGYDKHDKQWQWDCLDGIVITILMMIEGIVVVRFG